MHFIPLIIHHIFEINIFFIKPVLSSLFTLILTLGFAHGAIKTEALAVKKAMKMEQGEMGQNESPNSPESDADSLDLITFVPGSGISTNVPFQGPSSSHIIFQVRGIEQVGLPHPTPPPKA